MQRDMRAVGGFIVGTALLACAAACTLFGAIWAALAPTTGPVSSALADPRAWVLDYGFLLLGGAFGVPGVVVLLYAYTAWRNQPPGRD